MVFVVESTMGGIEMVSLWNRSHRCVNAISVIKGQVSDLIADTLGIFGLEERLRNDFNAMGTLKPRRASKDFNSCRLPQSIKRDDCKKAMVAWGRLDINAKLIWLGEALGLGIKFSR